MNDADRRLFATWQHIAERASKETDPDKLAQVVEELRAALELHEGIKPEAAATLRESCRSNASRCTGGVLRDAERSMGRGSGLVK